MSVHLCRFTNLSKEKLKQLLAGRNRCRDIYRCGGCLKTFETICVLHYHCMKHNEGGSYYFDHVTNTAYPKYDSKCSYAQVNLERPDDSESYERILTASERSINEISQSDGVEMAEEHGIDCEQCVMVDHLESEIDSDHGLTAVNVKNIAKAADGLITFEMDEKDAHLFDATASVIMDRINMMGDSWLKLVTELQVMVPNKGSKVSATKMLGSDANKNDSSIVDSVANETSDTEHLNTSGDMEGSHINETWKEDTVNSVMPLKDVQSPSEVGIKGQITEVHEVDDVRKAAKELENPDTDQHVENNESTQDNTTMSDVTFNARPVRNRKPSSRLSASEWETPVKRKKVENHDSAGKDKHAPVKKTEKLSPDVRTSKSGRLKNEVRAESIKPPELTAEEATSADISASKVLLSLSKGVNKALHSDGQVEEKKSRTLRRRKSNDKRSVGIDKTNDIKEEIQDMHVKTGNKRNTDVKTEPGSDINTAVQVKRRKVSNRLLKRDTKMVATQRRSDYVCKTCGKVGTKAMLDYHRQAHGVDSAFRCEVCGKEFKTRQCFSAHMRQHGERKYKCDQCPAAFFRKQYLDTHMRKHTGEVPYVCDLCGSGFMEFYILQRHITNKHKQERNYMCNVCGERFFRADTRDNHRTRHFEPTLKCAYCSKMFKAELDRRKHELTHTGEKQFFCPICNYGFAQLWPYYRHMWKKHSISKEEAKDMKVKNPDMVYMRNKHVEHERGEKRERTHQEPLYTVNKRVSKPDRTAEDEAEIGGSKYMEMEGEGEGTNYELMSTQAGQLTQGEYIEHERDMYEDVAHHQHMFVDSSDIPDGIVLQDGQTAEGRNTLVLGDGQNIETTNISIVLDDGQTGGHRNLVILSDYTQTDLEDYAKQYSSVDL